MCQLWVWLSRAFTRRSGNSIVIGAWKYIFPSSQAYMENTEAAHNHLCKSDIFPGQVWLYKLFLKNIIIPQWA